MGAWFRLTLHVFGLAALILGVGAGVAFTQTPESVPSRLSAFGTGPSDTGAWRSLLESAGYSTESVLTGPLALRSVTDPGRNVWVAVGVERPHTADEVATLHSFLARGGILLLADAGGYGNLVAGDFPVRFGPSRLLDERFQGNLSFVVADARFDGESYHILLNNPVGLLLSDEFAGESIVESSNRSYLDINDNALVDQSDVPGPFPVVARWTTPAGGRVVLSADVGVFLSQGLSEEAYDHAGFHRALAEFLLPQGGRFLIDESLHDHFSATDALGDAHRSVAHWTLASWLSWWLAAAGTIILVFPLIRRPPGPWVRHQPVFSPQPLPHKAERVTQAARNGALRILSHATGLTGEQLVALSPSDLASLTRDEVLRQAVLGEPALTPTQMEKLIDRLLRPSR